MRLTFTIILATGCANVHVDPSVPRCLVELRAARRGRPALYDRNGDHYLSLENATEDAPAAHALAVRATRSVHSWPMAFLGLLTIGAANITVALDHEHVGGQVASGVLYGAGATLFASGIALMVGARDDRRAAVARYNEWAQQHRCPAPSPQE